MSQNFRDQLLQIRKDNEVASVDFFNNGEIKTDNYSFFKVRELFKTSEEFKNIEDVFFKAACSYSYDGDYDEIDMHMIFGLVYWKKDVDENNHIRLNAKPINNVVRYYTGSVKSYLDGEQANIRDYERYGLGRQGYLNFDEFVSLAQKEGFSYRGPETFDDFKNAILTREPFDIVISMDLKQEEDNKLVRKL